MAIGKAYFGPQHVGGLFYNAYWRFNYQVLTIDQCMITTRIVNPGVFANLTVGKHGEVSKHSTGWSYSSDKVIAFRGYKELGYPYRVVRGNLVRNVHTDAIIGHEHTYLAVFMYFEDAQDFARKSQLACDDDEVWVRIEGPSTGFPIGNPIVDGAEDVDDLPF